ncbi:UrcA family protein [Caulobacter sp. NIBR2454]|uniref:UrcA family protein n=1 Tax=Caulobacter sp. NIBR2454 TaxID=3015996 RepID=UPI0022B697D4|nr:UrcA family protein [Caulobacter sp. NIBR2454]
MFKTVFAAAALTVALAGAAQAQVSVKVSDLDLSKAAGAAQLEQRIARAGRAVCNTEKAAWSRAPECRAAVRAEVQAQLASNGSVQLASR